MSNTILKISSQLKFFVNQPYPFYYKENVLVYVAALLFFMSLSFLYFFEPFEVYIPEHKIDYFWICFIHASTSVVIIGAFSLIKFHEKHEDNWTVYKEILLVCLFLLLVGVVQFLIRDVIYDNPNNWSWRYLYEEIRNTFLIGSLFVVLLVSLNHNRLNSKNIKSANSLNSLRKNTSPNLSTSITINTQVKSEEFDLNIDNFLFAKADGNYVELFLNKENIRKIIKRITIKELEATLEPYPNIIKTHRSYLVNLKHIKNVSGNAQGYKLEINHYEEKIPVSRNMIENFNIKMQKAQAENLN